MHPTSEALVHHRFQPAHVASASLPRGDHMISVCHVIPNDCWAGAEVQVATLLEELSRERTLCLSAVILGEGRLADEVQSYQVTTKIVRRASGSFLNCFREAEEFLRLRHVDIIHSHKSKGNILGVLLARRFGIQHVVRTQHGLPEPRTIKDRAAYYLEAITARYASSVICVSDDLRTRLSQRISCPNIDVVHNSVNLFRVRSELTVSAAKQRLDIEADAPVIGIVARLVPVKRIDLFLAASRQIYAEFPRAVFLIAGTGGDEPSLRQTIRGANIARNVRFLGQRDDIYDVMRAMDVLLISSDHEGLPTALLEAMALGVPTVSRNVGGIGEVVRDGINGLLVDSSEPETLARACLQMLCDEGNRRRLLLEGLKTARQFSSQYSAATIAQIYRYLIPA